MSHGHLITAHEIQNFKYICVGYKININTNLLWGFPGSSDGKETACNAGDLGSIPGSGGSPVEENSNSLQSFCLENPMGRGAWHAAVHGVAKNWT